MARAIDMDKAMEVAQIKYNDWNLAMAAADGQREINLCFKKQELFKAVKAVLECVPTLTPPNEWVSVEERLPEEKQRVIVRCERVGTSVGWILWGNWMTDIGPGAGKVTHWMPLPEPPDKDNHVPAKAPNEPLTCKGDENGEQRLIDANKILYHQAWESGSMEPANEGVALMSEVQAMPTIDPEALPIVRQLREELERVTAERDAAIKELDEVTSEVDDLAEFVDREIHPVVDYNLYLDLRENVDAVSMFQHEDEWRGLHKEE